MFVVYTFDGQGPFTTMIAKEKYNEAELKRVVMDAQKVRLEWIGKTLKV